MSLAQDPDADLKDHQADRTGDPKQQAHPKAITARSKNLLVRWRRRPAMPCSVTILVLTLVGTGVAIGVAYLYTGVSLDEALTGVGALVGLAAAGLFSIALQLQATELRHQRHELKLTRRELKQQHEETARLVRETARQGESLELDRSQREARYATVFWRETRERIPQVGDGLLKVTGDPNHSRGLAQDTKRWLVRNFDLPYAERTVAAIEVALTEGGIRTPPLRFAVHGAKLIPEADTARRDIRGLVYAPSVLTQCQVLNHVIGRLPSGDPERVLLYWLLQPDLDLISSLRSAIDRFRSHALLDGPVADMESTLHSALAHLECFIEREGESISRAKEQAKAGE
jgi:hypothetical protein